MVAAVCNADGSAWERTVICEPDAVCDRGACVGAIDWHLQRSVDLVWLQGYPAEQLDECTTQAEDLAAGRLLCDAFSSVKELQPRHAFFVGNSWVRLTPEEDGATDPCVLDARTPDEARTCIGERLGRIIDRLHAVAPAMIASAHLAEYVHKDSVGTDWPNLCQPWSVGYWGPDTCIPNMGGSQAARDELVRWAEVFVDAGVRSFVFGQAGLMSAFVHNSSSLSPTGAAGMQDVIDRTRAYATRQGVSHVYFGLQAAGSATIDGVEQADFILSAQHLETVDNYLLQPLVSRGPFIESTYHPNDRHELNLLNNPNNLPIVVQYDFSTGRELPDDIRRLAQVPTNDVRARTLLDHSRHLRAYREHAWLSIPVSSALRADEANQCSGINEWHFSASACGLLDAASDLFVEADEPSSLVGPTGVTSPPVRRDYWGQQLRGRDATLAWLYQTLLGRHISPDEYSARLPALPALIDTAQGARMTLAQEIVQSPEFEMRALSNQEVVSAIYAATLLREPDPSGGAFFVGQLDTGAMTPSQVISAVSASEEANGLYRPTSE